MKDDLKHECGIAVVRLLKPLSFYKEKYGTAFYGLNKMYLLMEKQHNRGQDGSGLASIKFNVEPGERYISRIRSTDSQPIQDIFTRMNQRINQEFEKHPEYLDDVAAQKKHIPYLGEVYLGHVRYATNNSKSIEHVHPFLRQNNWMHRNLILAGNFNMTNTDDLFKNLVRLGMHPKEKTDAVTLLERIGHFLDEEVIKMYKRAKDKGLSKQEASPYIAEHLKVQKILRKSASNWDGGYAIAGLLGHGDAFVLRDPAGIRPVYYYQDEEVVAIASERPPIQTTYNVPFDQIQELEPGHAIIIKRNGKIRIHEIIPPIERRSCSFERIYFSRGNDAEIYEERKMLGKLVMPKVLKAIDYDTENSVFSYIPNTAETSFYGMLDAAQDELNKQKNEAIIRERKTLTLERLHEIQAHKIRTEKIAVKDVKLRTFIADDNSRNDLAAHVYDVTYGVVKPDDNLVIIDDSIVRGTTLKTSILKMLDRLHPKKIIVVSSAPQIRYPDCYGINMPNLEDLIAFQAALALHKERGTEEVIREVYEKCLDQVEKENQDLFNHVKKLYEPFSDEEISDKIADIIAHDNISAELKIIFQSVDDLHKACPKNLGDWYFTGNYPTSGGNRVVNQAYISFFEKYRM